MFVSALIHFPSLTSETFLSSELREEYWRIYLSLIIYAILIKTFVILTMILPKYTARFR